MAKKVKRVQDYDLAYDILRYYVDFVLKLSYRRVRYVGLDRVPQDGAIIYAPNHTNTLMDAMVILAMTHKAKVFVARADIFRNPKLAKVLTWFKIMPIMRMRDGYDQVKKNQEIFDRSVDVLRDKVPFCIFPEGTHQAKYSSLPLSKGIFRIAFQAQEQMPDMPLYIVPIGIRYGSFFRFRSTVRVQVGEPINVGEYISSHSEMTTQEQMTQMRELLTERMKEAIFYIPNDENYNAVYEICAATVKQQAKLNKRRKQNKVDAHFEANNITVKQIEQLKQSNPTAAEKLLQLGNEASAIRRSRSISLASVSVRFPVLSRIIKTLVTVITLPYCLSVSILSLPIHLLCNFLFSKLKDPAFRNSIRFVANLVIWPLLMIIYSIIAYCNLPWQWALPVTLALLPAPIVAHETWRLLRLFVSDIKYISSPDLRSKYSAMREIIFNN